MLLQLIGCCIALAHAVITPDSIKNDIHELGALAYTIVTLASDDDTDSVLAKAQFIVALATRNMEMLASAPVRKMLTGIDHHHRSHLQPTPYTWIFEDDEAVNDD